MRAKIEGVDPLNIKQRSWNRIEKDVSMLGIIIHPVFGNSTT